MLLINGSRVISQWRGTKFSIFDRGNLIILLIFLEFRTCSEKTRSHADSRWEVSHAWNPIRPRAISMVIAVRRHSKLRTWSDKRHWAYSSSCGYHRLLWNENGKPS